MLGQDLQPEILEIAIAIGAVDNGAKGPIDAFQKGIGDPILELVEDLVPRHFSREEMNILVMDVSRTPGVLKSRIPLIQRRLQPGTNRRFGAVMLFHR